MKVFRDESGQMLVFTALTMTALLGFLALATDVGTLFRAKRQLQIAADAAATAGAMDVLFGYSNTQAIADARSAAAANGATNGSKGTVVTVNTTPLSGYHKSQGYVEVLITQPNPTFFMRLFGHNSVTIGARSVAGSPGYATNCCWLMDPTGIDMQLQGSNKVNSIGGGWYINSDGSNPLGSAFSLTGNALTVIAPYIDVVANDSPGITGTTVYPNSIAESAPNLQSTGAIPPGDCTVTKTAGAYATTIDGADGVVCFSAKNVDISGSTLQNGVFVFENGVVVGNPTGNTTVTNGTIDVYGGQFTQNSDSNLNITAPASLTETFGGLSYDAVGILVPAANTTYTNAPCQTIQNGNPKSDVLQIQFGSNNQTLDGYIVAPNAMLYLQDNGGGVTYSGLYASCLYGKSSILNIPSYNAEHPSTTPLRTVSLVE